MNTAHIVLDARVSGYQTHDRVGSWSAGARASGFFDDLVLVQEPARISAQDIGLVVYALAAVVAVVLLWLSQS